MYHYSTLHSLIIFDAIYCKHIYNTKIINTTMLQICD